MSDQPKEAFPWRANKDLDDQILDANGFSVLTIDGYDGDASHMRAPGIAERRRMILELSNLIELAREVAYGIHYCPDEKVETARRIMARIEGKS